MSTLVSPAALGPKAAAAYSGFSLPTFWRLVKNDADFPKVFKLSPNRSAVLRVELDAWLAAKRQAAEV